ncbi:MAG: hypothetical protein U5J64_12030 [Halobacteriales archaeon]|nr:hypothetical protein [Halobacteriales archaeon]
MSDEIDRLVEFLKVRLTLLVGSAFFIATFLLGLVDLLSTTSIDAVPIYVHATVGAVVFPVSVFVLEYRGFEMKDAVQTGTGAGAVVVVVLLLLTEGAGRMTNEPFGLGASTLFYVITVSLVSSTLIVIWVGRNYLDVPASERGRHGRRGRAPRRD